MFVFYEVVLSPLEKPDVSGGQQFIGRGNEPIKMHRYHLKNEQIFSNDFDDEKLNFKTDKNLLSVSHLRRKCNSGGKTKTFTNGPMNK